MWLKCSITLYKAVSLILLTAWSLRGVSWVPVRRPVAEEPRRGEERSLSNRWTMGRLAQFLRRRKSVCYWYVIKQIFVPACSIAQNRHCFDIFCNLQTLKPRYSPKYATVSKPSSSSPEQYPKRFNSKFQFRQKLIQFNFWFNSGWLKFKQLFNSKGLVVTQSNQLFNSNVR